MIFKKDKKNNIVVYSDKKLTLEIEKLFKQFKKGNFSARGETENSECKEVIDNINEMLNMMEARMEDRIEADNKSKESLIKECNYRYEELKNENNKLSERLNFANKVAKIGLWEINIVDGDAMNENNTVKWTEEFRNLLGFSSEAEFPNVQKSWSDRIHPDAVELVAELYTKHVNDSTGSTPYSIPYKIRLKNGEYRWFHSEAHTIRDEWGKPVKVVGSIRDISGERAKEELEKELTDKIMSFSQSMGELVEGVEGVTKIAQDLAKYQEDTMKVSHEMKEGTAKTQEITEFIKNLSSQINLLGLNASIEAARSGQNGLGFNVVATEIRKLSISSSSAINEIESSIKGMGELVKKIADNVENINRITQTQAASTEEISACAEEMNFKAEDLLSLSKKVNL